jgi:hypothetical protein
MFVPPPPQQVFNQLTYVMKLSMDIMALETTPPLHCFNKLSYNNTNMAAVRTCGVAETLEPRTFCVAIRLEVVTPVKIIL